MTVTVQCGEKLGVVIIIMTEGIYFWIWSFLLIMYWEKYFKSIKLAVGEWNGSVGWNNVPCTKGLWIWQLVGAGTGSNWWMFLSPLSPSLSLSLSLSPPTPFLSSSGINEHIWGWRFLKKSIKEEMANHALYFPFSGSV